MEALSSLEFLLLATLGVAALLVAVASGARSLSAGASSSSGEVVWSMVAVALLAGVAAVVGLGGGHVI